MLIDYTIKRLLTFAVLLFSFSLQAAPKAELWDYWTPNAQNQSITLDHQPLQRFLDHYLVEQGQHNLVKYAQVSPNDKQALKDYLSEMGQVNPHQLTRAQQYAYWVNLYNAHTIDIILDNYPTKSITKLGGFFSFGPWDQDVTTINGKALTLNDIEHRILRPIWNDARTHYAVNCASLGCPNLQAQAFTASNTETLLEQAKQNYVLSKKGVNLTNGTLTLSSIYDWFKVDFGGEEGVMEHIAALHPEVKGYTGKIQYDYDWSLNEPK